MRQINNKTAKAGEVKPLVHLLTDGSMVEGKGEAAAALANLAWGKPRNKMVISKAEGSHRW